MRVNEVIVGENTSSNNLHATSSKALTTSASAPNLLISFRTANTFSDDGLPKVVRCALEHVQLYKIKFNFYKPENCIDNG